MIAFSTYFINTISKSFSNHYNQIGHVSIVIAALLHQMALVRGLQGPTSIYLLIQKEKTDLEGRWRMIFFPHINSLHKKSMHTCRHAPTNTPQHITAESRVKSISIQGKELAMESTTLHSGTC